MINEQLKEAVMATLCFCPLSASSRACSRAGRRLPKCSRVWAKVEFVDGLRVTDKESVELVQMVLAGKINKNLVT
jgi:acetylglutamate kinase